MIEKEEIEKLAELSRMEVTPEEVEKFSKDIESILEYVSELKEIAIDEDVREAGILRNIMREDGEPHEKGIYTKDILNAAPST